MQDSEAVPFRTRVAEGARLLGTFLKMPTDQTVYILAQEGFDFVVIDEEHAALNPETTDRMLAGLDAFFIGRGDLTVAYGADSQDAAAVRDAVRAVTEAASRAGRRVFALSAAPDDAAELASMGVTGILTATDQALLRHGAKAARERFASVLQGRE